MLVPQGSLLLVSSLVLLLSWLGVLPSAEVLFDGLKHVVRTTSIAILPIAMLENLVAVNLYFPGALVVAVAMAAAAGDPAVAVVLYGWVFLGSMTGNVLSYVLGRILAGRSRSWERVIAQPKELPLAFCYLHPHLAASTAFILGSRGRTVTEYFRLAIPAGAFWSLTWCVLFYSFGGMTGDGGGGFVVLFYLLVIAWAAHDAIRLSRERNPAAKGKRDGQHKTVSLGSPPYDKEHHSDQPEESDQQDS
jgi:hypothetical protein